MLRLRLLALAVVAVARHPDDQRRPLAFVIAAVMAVALACVAVGTKLLLVIVQAVAAGRHHHLTQSTRAATAELRANLTTLIPPPSHNVPLNMQPGRCR